MLKDPNSPYEGKRSNYLLKYKPNFDAEAVIVGYKPGQGKYQGHLGGFICKPLINHDTYMSVDDNDDHGFSISGMDDEVRKTYQSTHPLGTIISYEHSGKTDKGKPRFPRYTRM
jgi:DNA ligase-1